MINDSIPSEAKIEPSDVPHRDNIDNFASDEEISKNTVRAISDYETRFDSDRSAWASGPGGLWNQMDAAYRAFINNASVEQQRKHGANTKANEERARMATTQFHRQVAQMASTGYSYQTAKEVPFKYEPLKEGMILARDDSEKANLLAKWTMKKDRFDLKCIDFWWQIKKYGNIPVMVEWMTRSDEREIRTPIIGEDGSIEGFEFEMEEYIAENRPVFSILPIESVKADPMIGNIQDQECVIVVSTVGLSEIVAGIRDGYYREDLLEDLKANHQWDGSTGKPNKDEKKNNRDLANIGDGTCSGQYLKREGLINIPVDDGEWDGVENIPERYRVTLFGNDPSSSLVARIERNQEPKDSIPIEMIHAKPDDTDYLYHISDYEVVRSNMSVETTLIRQIIDNGGLVNKNVMWEVMNEVQGGVSGPNDREFKSGQRFILNAPNSMGQFAVRDISQSAMGVLEYIKEDSNTALSIDRNMTGKSYGARTSALEADEIADNAKRPNMVGIEYILEQLLGFVADRYMEGWKAYALPEQVIHITGKDEKEFEIHPAQIDWSLNIVVDILDDVKVGAVEVNRLMNYAQTMAGIPGFAQTTDWEKLNKVIAEKMLGTSEFVTADYYGDTVAVARTNLYDMFNTELNEEDRIPEFAPNMDIVRHLQVYKEERIRLKGKEEANPSGIEILEKTIAQLESQIAQASAPQPQQQQQQQVQQSEGQPPSAEGEMARQELSGAMGGMNGAQ